MLARALKSTPSAELLDNLPEPHAGQASQLGRTISEWCGFREIVVPSLTYSGRAFLSCNVGRCTLHMSHMSHHHASYKLS